MATGRISGASDETGEPVSPDRTHMARLMARIPGRADKTRAALTLQIVEIDGVEIEIAPASSDADFALWRDGKPKDRLSIAFLADAIEGHPAIFYDVEAGGGHYPIFMRKSLGEGSRVIAFDAGGVETARLMKNLAKAGLGGIAKVHRASLTGGWLSRYLTPKPAGGFIVARISGGREDQVILPALEQADPELWPDFLLIDRSQSDSWSTDLIEALEALDYALVYEAEGNSIFYRDEADALERIHLYASKTGDDAGAKE